MKKSLVRKFGLLGYPGYDWLSQAVSDLSAANAPSLALWNLRTAFYNVCEVVCLTVVCIGVQGQKNKLLRVGIYLFAVMEWISAVGYRAFPLSDSGSAGAFQDVMHMVITACVVLLSIASLSVIIIAGAKNKDCRSYGICAAVALAMMLVGALAITGNILFYGKSGFVPAKTKGVRYADDPEADYLLIKELIPGFLDGISGTYKDPEGYFVCEKDPEAFERFEATFPKKEKQKLSGQLF